MSAAVDHTELTAVIVNYRTPDLLRRAIGSFREFYPGVPLLLIDNGSGDESRTLLSEIRSASPADITVTLNERNRHHGPAMDQALHSLDADFVLFLDSDCVVHRGGWLEEMLKQLTSHSMNYMIGQMTFMNRRGFDVEKTSAAIPYIRPICMLLRRELYRQLPPFRRHGAPCLENVREAQRRGYRLLDFPVEKAVSHEGRGTAGKYGYRLGVRGRLNHLLNKIGL